MILTSTLRLTISFILKGVIRHPFLGKNNRIIPVTAAQRYTCIINSKKMAHFDGQPSKCSLSSNIKSAHDLQSQWAGGRDIWLTVPDGKNTISLTTRVKMTPSGDDVEKSSLSWPKIVQTSILYGFGAYNPRGVVATEEYNIQHHEMLKADIKDGLASLFHSAEATWWDAASLWEDGSSERGFVVAFSRAMSDHEAGKNWCMSLASKYQQGAIYEFEYESDPEVPSNGKMHRRTVAVLDAGTEADVEIVVDSLGFVSNVK